MSLASLPIPNDLVDELLAESSDQRAQAVAEAERASLLANRSAVQDRRKRAIDLYTRGKLSDDEFDAIAADVERELNTLDERLAVLEPDDDSLDDAVSEDVLAEFRHRLAEDISDAERREIVQLLVRRITVHTTLTDRGRKQVRVVIDYRFPRVGEARTGIAASPSYNLRRVPSPPEPESPHHRPHPAPRISAYFPRLRFTELDGCRVAVSSTRVTLRSNASAPLLQSPVQQAGRKPLGFRMPSDMPPLAAVGRSVHC